MPDSATRARGCRSLLQPLKSPITQTASALGAKTAKEVPATPSTVRGWEPSFS